jgi:hypothetical protein
VPFQKIDLVRRSVSENGVKRVKMVLSYFFIWGIYSTSDSIAVFFSLDSLQKCLSQILKQIRRSSYRFRDIRGQMKPTPKVGTFL